jgi:hypothetical protein
MESTNPSDVSDVVLKAIDGLNTRFLALAANAHKSGDTAELLRALSGISDELEAYEECYALPVDSVFNEGVSGQVCWSSTARMAGQYFSWDDEKEIVAELPRAVVCGYSSFKDAEGHHLEGGLFLGHPQWSNIEYAYKKANELIPTRTAALLQACKDGVRH